MGEKELKLVDNCKYDLRGYIYFTAKSALEIAYALFDSVGHSYDELDEISDELI